MKCDYFESCGNMAVDRRIDPYYQELLGEKIWRWYCETCYYNDLLSS